MKKQCPVHLTCCALQKQMLIPASVCVCRAERNGLSSLQIHYYAASKGIILAPRDRTNITVNPSSLDASNSKARTNLPT